ncbi:hypothetical protein RHMOL_Rhmol05G0061800 [Rhododendron molle]|uniref:Uncharacterized protein n=1 Tax=Rhododendron molle TaxID=49168 RepID=A0ACC0NMG2_RHOML|nr:hypothetical protein RHMOL_Rhmol05G0061800 [Rhododendron molle]
MLGTTLSAVSNIENSLIRNTMEGVEAEIVIVGAGIAGLTTSLGLHRLGIRSSVLESSESLRVSGFAFTTWTNAWRALDGIGIGDSLRQQHDRLYGIVASSIISGLPTSEMSFTTKASHGDHEVRCVRRKFLLEALQKELPSGTIRFSSKVVSIEEDSGGCFKMVHLANGSAVKAKVLIGCDGVNSVVSKWLGFKKPASWVDLPFGGLQISKAVMGLSPNSCCSLERACDVVLPLVMKALCIGFSPSLAPQKVRNY